MIAKALCTLAALACLLAPAAWAQADLVWRQPNGQVTVWTMVDGQRATVTDIGPPVGSEWHLAGAGDINASKDAELIWQRSDGQVQSWSVKKAGQYLALAIDKPVGPDWRIAGLGDIDGDRTDDIVWENKNGAIEYWKMGLGLRRDRLPVDRAGANERLVGVGDVDGNGSADLVFLRADGQPFYWRMSKGRRVDALNIAKPMAPDWRLAGIGDVNGDGFADLVWLNQSGKLQYWAMYDGQRMGVFDIAEAVDPSWRLAGLGDVFRTPEKTQAIAPHPGEFAIPVETLTLAKAKGKLMESAISVGGYTIASSIDVVDGGPAYGDDRAPWRAKKQAMISTRFSKDDGTVLLTAQCSTYYRMWSRQLEKAGSVHSCAFEGSAATDASLEVVLPKIAAPSTGPITIIVEDIDADETRYNGMRARMRYKDVTYEAAPFGVDHKRCGTAYRVALGYTIARDGKLIGRIDFPPPKRAVMAFGDSLDRQSVITAPVADADGREAVILFAAQLLRMPEPNPQP
jgi:hypothetical protein